MGSEVYEPPRYLRGVFSAILKFLEQQTDAISSGLLKSLSCFDFVFGLQFLKLLFEHVNVASEALQATDVDFAAAAIDDFKKFVQKMRRDEMEYIRLFDSTFKLCLSLGIDLRSEAPLSCVCHLALTCAVRQQPNRSVNDSFHRHCRIV